MHYGTCRTKKHGIFHTGHEITPDAGVSIVVSALRTGGKATYVYSIQRWASSRNKLVVSCIIENSRCRYER